MRLIAIKTFNRLTALMILLKLQHLLNNVLLKLIWRCVFRSLRILKSALTWRLDHLSTQGLRNKILWLQ